MCEYILNNSNAYGVRNLPGKEALTTNTRARSIGSEEVQGYKILLTDHDPFFNQRVRFNFRLPFGKSFQITYCDLKHSITYNKSKGKVEVKEQFGIIEHLFGHGQFRSKRKDRIIAILFFKL